MQLPSVAEKVKAKLGNELSAQFSEPFLLYPLFSMEGDEGGARTRLAEDDVDNTETTTQAPLSEKKAHNSSKPTPQTSRPSQSRSQHAPAGSQDREDGLCVVCHEAPHRPKKSSCESCAGKNIGCRVRITGLSSSAGQVYNGRTGMIRARGVADAKGAWRVVLEVELPADGPEDDGDGDVSSPSKKVITVRPSNAVLCCQECGAVVEKLLLCGRCQLMRYCSRNCQKQAWNQHKEVCAQDKSGKHK
jgi:hypothetical protein